MIKLKVKTVSANIMYQGTKKKSKVYRDFEKVLLGDKKRMGLLFEYRNLKYKGFVEIKYYIGSPNYLELDIDNCLKTITDVIDKAGIIENDKKVMKVSGEKFYAKEHMIYINIIELRGIEGGAKLRPFLGIADRDYSRWRMAVLCGLPQ